MNGPPRLADNARKTLKSLPRSVIVLIFLCLLGLGGFMIIRGFLFAFGDETALRVIHIYLADLNEDEHQDAFMVTNQMHRIAFSDGAGNFTSSRELFMRKYALALGDLDGDGQLDAILERFEHGEMGGEPVLECGEMSSDFVFPLSTADVPNQVFAIRDGNRDGIPEDFVAGCCGGGTTMMNYEFLPSDRHWSSPYLEVRVYAPAGNVPEGNWECDEKLAEAKSQSGYFDPPPTPVPLPVSEVSVPRVTVEPLLQADSFSTGNWSPDGKFLVLGLTEYFMTNGEALIVASGGDGLYYIPIPPP